MKKRLALSLILAVCMVVSLALVACTPETHTYDIVVENTAILLEKGETQTLTYQATKDGSPDASLKVNVSVAGDSVTYSKETGEITAVKSGTTVLTLSIEGQEVTREVTVTVPTYTIEFRKPEATIFVDETLTVSYTVKKDGANVNNKKVILSTDSDAVYLNTIKKEVTGIKPGESAVITATLEDDPEVTATMTYFVKGVFFSRDDELQRGQLDFANEDDGRVEILGGQATILARQDSTKFVFRTTLTIRSHVGIWESFGVGSFRDKGDNALWFGLRGTEQEGIYSVYIRDFYDGWNTPSYDSEVKNYKKYEFGTTIDCVIVRDGANYWYSIGGLTGSYTTEAHADEPTFPGVYSQEKLVTVTNFSVAYDQETVDKAKEECGTAVAKLIINESAVTLLEKGAQFTYTTTTYSQDDLSEPVVWTIDKSEMTAGAESTTLENGKLMLANDAAGYVTIKASCGGKEASVRVEISSEELDKENETVKVSGGVDLDASGKVIFSEERNFNNETLVLNKYQEVPYMAKLIDTVKGDFALTFKVASYKSTSANPTLLISLGGEGNNFVITQNGIIAYTYNTNADNSYTYGVNTATNRIDMSAEHLFKIEVVGGKYKVYVDGVEAVFPMQAVRRVQDYIANSNIMFTTIAGTSCELSQIELVHSEAQMPYLYTVNNNATITEEGFKINMSSAQWAAKDNHITRLYSTAMLPAGDFMITMDVKFSQVMADAKLALCIGGWEFHVNNKGDFQGELFPGSWSGLNGATGITATETVKVTVQRLGNKARFYVGETLISEREGCPSDRLFSFYTFDIVGDGHVEVSNFQIIDKFISLTGPSGVQKGSSAEMVYQVYGAEASEIEWILDTANLTSGSATLENGVLAFSNEAAGSVVVTAKLGAFTRSIEVVPADQPDDQDTALALSIGGVKQDVENGIITFSAEHANKNGVANEEEQVLSSYYAKLKTPISGNFSIEFTVSDYVTTATFPKLMISLGGRANQFYIVYNREGSINRVETFTYSKYPDGRYDAGNGAWVSSDSFGADFDNTVAQSYKITCTEGVYKVYLKVGEQWQELRFSIDGGETRTMLRAARDIYGTSDIILSTNSGTSCSVSNIKVETSKANVNEFAFSHNANFTAIEGGFTLNFPAQSWNDANYAVSTAVNLDLPAGDYDIDFKVSFSSTMHDGKLAVALGSMNKSFTICNSVDWTTKAEIQGVWGGAQATDWDVSDLSVKLSKRGNTITMVINGNYKVNGSVELSGIESLNFYAFNNYFEDDVNKTVTVSNFVVTPVNA